MASRLVWPWISASAWFLLAAGLANAGGWKWWQKDEAAPPAPTFDQTPGVRQIWHKGLPWPPQPRPTSPPARCIDQYHAAKYWPYPYTCGDRAATRSAMDIQAANGWLSHTTLYDHYFDPVSNELNSSGRMHLEWIILQAPPQYRAAYVAAMPSEQINQDRLLNVQLAATEISGGDAGLPISMRRALPFGASAQEIDLIRRKWLSTTPDPRIQYATPSIGSEEQ